MFNSALTSALTGLDALLQCLAYIAWAVIFVRFSILLPWAEFRSRRVGKKYPKIWLAVAIVLILSWLLYFVLIMDKNATGVDNYHIMRRITFFIAVGAPIILIIIQLIMDLFRKRWRVSDIAIEANEIRDKNGEKMMVSTKEVLIAQTVAKMWANVVCNNLAISSYEKRIFIQKVTIQLLVKLPGKILCDDRPDHFFEEALGEDYPIFKKKFPTKTIITIDWEKGYVC